MSELFDAIVSGNREKLPESCTAEELEARNPEGWTALHLAAFYGRAQIVEWLLEQGAELGAVSGNAMANQPLHAALAGEREPDVIRALLAAGADPNARAATGVTPLHLAAARGDQAMVDLLLEAGARPGRMDDGTTPADLARERGHGALNGLDDGR